MQVKPIRSKEDHAEALKQIEELWGSKQGTEKGDLLDVLVTLVEVYEREHFPIDLPDPVEAIKFRLEQLGKGYQELVGIIGQRTRVYEVMRRDRPLSLAMIRNLNTKLRIPAEVLIHPGKLRKKRASGATVKHGRESA